LCLSTFECRGISPGRCVGIRLLGIVCHCRQRSSERLRTDDVTKMSPSNTAQTQGVGTPLYGSEGRRGMTHGIHHERVDARGCSLRALP
jgi:hypothetical protein